MENIQNKMSIEKDSRALRLYFFTVQKGNLAIEIPEDVKAILAYSGDEAFEKVRNDYTVNTRIAIKQRASVPIHRIVDVVDLNPLVPQSIKIEAAPQVSENKSKKDFIYGMMLIADRFIESDRDRNTLKRILKKVLT